MVQNSKYEFSIMQKGVKRRLFLEEKNRNEEKTCQITQPKKITNEYKNIRTKKYINDQKPELEKRTIDLINQNNENERIEKNTNNVNYQHNDNIRTEYNINDICNQHIEDNRTEDNINIQATEIKENTNDIINRNNQGYRTEEKRGDEINEQEEITQENINDLNVTEGEKGFTKTGKLRERRKFEQSKKERVDKKIQEQREKMSLKSPCNFLTCKKKCSMKIDDSQRKKINDSYVALSFEEQGLVIKMFS